MAEVHSGFMPIRPAAALTASDPNQPSSAALRAMRLNAKAFETAHSVALLGRLAGPVGGAAGVAPGSG